MLDLFFVSIELGLLYGLVALGVFLTFRVLDFPDLTVDGSFVIGAAATTVALHARIPGLLAALCGCVAGCVAGCLTAYLHTRLGIGKILSGILSLSILYTVNLRLMHGPNISLLRQSNTISWLQTPMNDWYVILWLLLIVGVVKIGIDWFLQTEIGLRVRATGDNERAAPSFGINSNTAKYIGIAISNGLVAFSGGLIAQYQGFVDVGMGMGIIILGFAAVLLGEAMTSRSTIPTLTTCIVLGAIVYQGVINVALRLGLQGTDLKCVTAFIVIGALYMGNKKKIFGL